MNSVLTKMYPVLSIRSAPFARHHANVLANVVCTQIIPFRLPQGLYENGIESDNDIETRIKEMVAS